MKSEKYIAKPFYIYSQKLATILMSKGFKLEIVIPNKDYPNLNVFVFGDSPEVRECVSNYNKNKNKQN